MPFTFQIQTTSNPQTFGFIADAGTLSIDWGDTQTTTESTPTNGARTHVYSTAGTYNVSLTGTATRIAFYGTGATPTLLIDVLTKMSDGLTGITSGDSMFRGCTNITTFTEPAFFDGVSGGVTTLNRMFNSASSFNMDLNNWDISNVTILTHTFSGCTVFNGNITSWNTSKVTYMDGTFYNAKAFNQPIGNWDTSKVVYFNTAYEGTFQGATAFNQPLNSWNTSSATIMANMFYNANSFNQPLNNWDTSKVTSMNFMFYGATAFNQDISNWNVSSVTIATNMFNGVTLPTVVYDGILIKWSKQILKPNVTISFGSSKYSNGLPLESKNLMASNFTWTITDGSSTGQTYIDHKKAKIKYDFPKDYVAYYSMDNIDGTTLIDETGNNNGTIYGATQVDGKIGKALSFDGVDDYVDCGNTHAGNYDMTISFRVKPNGTQAGGLIYKTNNYSNIAEDYHIFWWTGNQGIQIGFSDGSSISYNNLGGSGIIISNEWQLINIVKTGAKVDVYRNGVFSSSANNYPVNVQNTATPLIIGRESVGTKRAFKGSIDEVMIFNRALSEEEIKKIYNIGLGKYKIKVKGNSLNEGLVGYWTMDNVSGSDLIADKGNNGTIYGATQVDGKLGKALSFDGVDDYVNTTSTFIDEEPFTFCSWFYPNTVNTDAGIVIQSNSAGNRNGVVLTGERLVALVRKEGGVGVAYYTTPNAYVVGQWNFVAGIWDGTNAKIFVNGTEYIGGSRFSVSNASANITFIGRNQFANGTGTRYFNGIIDDTMIYNRALSLEEINKLYNNGIGKYNPFYNKIKIGG